MTEVLLSPSELAEEFGCRRQTVVRAAARVNVGVYAAGRMVAVRPKDKAKVRKAIHPTRGNPEFGTVWTGAGYDPKRASVRK